VRSSRRFGFSFLDADLMICSNPKNFYQSWMMNFLPLGLIVSQV
jgi:hypothetical protein